MEGCKKRGPFSWRLQLRPAGLDGIVAYPSPRACGSVELVELCKNLPTFSKSVWKQQKRQNPLEKSLFSRDLVASPISRHFPYKCVETAKEAKSFEYGKCLETGITAKYFGHFSLFSSFQDTFQYGKSLETGEITKSLENIDFFKGFGPVFKTPSERWQGITSEQVVWSVIV